MPNELKQRQSRPKKRRKQAVSADVASDNESRLSRSLDGDPRHMAYTTADVDLSHLSPRARAMLGRPAVDA